jgi:hypothetical protein
MLVIPAMVPTLAPVRIMADLITGVIRVPSLWQSVIALITLVDPDIGRATGITSGSLDIGFIGTGRKCGDAATTLCGDIDRETKERRLCNRVGDLEIALP